MISKSFPRLIPPVRLRKKDLLISFAKIKIAHLSQTHKQYLRQAMSSLKGNQPGPTTTFTNQESSQPKISSFATAREERRWNRLSDKMNSFHACFKQEFNTVYQLTDGSFNSHGLSLTRYLEMAKSLSHHLTMHHTIEERYIFPLLAKFMPKFGDTDEGEHLASHRGIHEGLEKLDSLVAKWKAEPSTYSPTELRACLDGFRDVLYHHLDEEVADLRGENLKKYMTLADVDAMPM